MIRNQLFSNGWRRHSVISMSHDSLPIALANLPPRIQDKLSITGAILIVATYDCAVVNQCFESEPWVQLLVAIPTIFNKQFSKGRDPRRIHFNIEHLTKEIALEVSASGICQIDRILLCDMKPDCDFQLSDSYKYDLKQWLAERFRQDTWPDAFNAAIKPAIKRLKKLWMRYNNYISGMYLKLNSYEELSTGKYEASIILLIEDGKQRAMFQDLRSKNNQLEGKNIDDLKSYIVSEVLNAFGDTLLVNPDPTNPLNVAIEVRGESEITVQQQRVFYRFSPYSLSEFESDAPQPIEMTPTKAGS